MLACVVSGALKEEKGRERAHRLGGWKRSSFRGRVSGEKPYLFTWPGSQSRSALHQPVQWPASLCQRDCLALDWNPGPSEIACSSPPTSALWGLRGQSSCLFHVDALRATWPRVFSPPHRGSLLWWHCSVPRTPWLLSPQTRPLPCSRPTWMEPEGDRTRAIRPGAHTRLRLGRPFGPSRRPT